MNQSLVPVLQHARARRRPNMGVLLLCAVILSLLYLLIIRMVIHSLPDTSVGAETTPPAVPSPTQNITTYSAVSLDVPEYAQVGACSGTPFVAQDGLTLSSLPSGVHVQQEDPHLYTVHGSTLDEIRAAIESCVYREPAGTHHALTRYVLNWQYTVRNYGSTCTLASVKVGMHISLLMPALASSVELTSSDRTTWDTYAARLAAHEAGHSTINRRHAGELYSALTRLRAANCTVLETTARATIASHLALLDADHESYDTHTDHGATEGARL